MSRTAHNKLTIQQVNNYCSSINIEFVDDEYLANSYPHKWKCGRCSQTVIQRLDKIKRAGKLNCCSRVSDKNVFLGQSIAKEHNLIFKELTFKNTQVANDWECIKHGIFTYSLFTALQLKGTSPCKKCREDVSKQILKNELEELYKSVPFITLVDSLYKGKRCIHKWKCTTHNYVTTSRLNLILKNKRLKCCRGEAYRGKNHPFYNKDISDEQRIKMRNYNASTEWSKAVRTRDKWECVICGYNSKCVAHHLDSYMAHPELRYTIENGVTLCRPHHMDFHKKYGIKCTTRENFEDYIRLYH